MCAFPAIQILFQPPGDNATYAKWQPPTKASVPDSTTTTAAAVEAAEDFGRRKKRSTIHVPVNEKCLRPNRECSSASTLKDGSCKKKN